MTPELHEVAEKAEAHYRESLRFLGDSVSLVEDFVHLYQRALDIAAGSPLANQPEHLLCAEFLMATRYYLVTAVLACFRGHIVDVYPGTRQAIEQAGFAALIKRRPDLAIVWRDASRNKATYNEYLNSFRSKELYPASHPQLNELRSRYDVCARQTHPSIHSFAGRSRMEEDDRSFTLKFYYFQVSSDGSEPVGSFLWILNTHMLIANVFREALVDVLAADAQAYEVLMNAIEARLGHHTAQWLEKIPALRPQPK